MINGPVRFTEEQLKGRQLWRYMSLGRFTWLLKNQALWLSRCDLLGDPWEARPTHAQIDALFEARGG